MGHEKTEMAKLFGGGGSEREGGGKSINPLGGNAAGGGLHFVQLKPGRYGGGETTGDGIGRKGVLRLGGWGEVSEKRKSKRGGKIPK